MDDAEPNAKRQRVGQVTLAAGEDAFIKDGPSSAHTAGIAQDDSAPQTEIRAARALPHLEGTQTAEPVRKSEGGEGSASAPVLCADGAACPTDSNTEAGVSAGAALAESKAEARSGSEMGGNDPQDALHPATAPTTSPLPTDAPPPPAGETAAVDAAVDLEGVAACPAVILTAGAYSAREDYLQNMEDEGQISFKYVVNDGQEHNSIWLIALKNIFSRQLPNMPREYIARLVLDRRHRSVAIVKRKRTVVGGITYRPFHAQGFAEIAFCAVTANEQVKGFGTRLMNYTKEFAVRNDSMQCFLTYADNNAVGYFAKQGFTKELTFDRERWVGYIKDYDGGTLMECLLDEKIPFARIPPMIRAQRAALDARIRGLSQSHVVYAGLPASHFDRESPDDLQIAGIPGVKEAGWTAEEDESKPRFLLVVDGERCEQNPEVRRRFMAQVLLMLGAQDEAWPFKEPVSAEEVPDYYTLVKNPMSLELMEERLKRGNYYLTLEIFVADIHRIFANARIYNAADSIFVKLANRLEDTVEQYLEANMLLEPLL